LYADLECVTIVGSTIKNYNDLFNKRIHMQARDCTFVGCRFDRPPIFQPQIDNRPNRFINCMIGAAGKLGNDMGDAPNYGYFLTTAQYGKFAHTVNGELDANVKYTYEYDFKDYDVRRLLTVATVTVNSTTRTATVTLPTTAGNFNNMVGSYLTAINGYATNSYLYDDTAVVSDIAVIGVITAFNAGTGVATVADVPPNITTNSYGVSIIQENYVMRPFTCDYSNGNTDLTNIEWAFPAVNDRVVSGGTLGVITAVNTGLKKATLANAASGTATDAVMNFPLAIRLDSPFPPSSGFLNATVYVLKGSRWYTKEIISGVAFDTVYEITGSGYLNATSAGGTRQATWNKILSLKQQTLTAYTPNLQSSAYTGPTLAEVNALRVAYENLRVAFDDLRGKLNSSGLTQ
jgi:hypothetical protein